MQREQRSNKNLRSSKPASNFAGTRKFDVDRLAPTRPDMLPAPEVDPGPMAKAKVAKGRCVHVPNGKKHIVGSEAYDVQGTIVHRDVTAEGYRSAGPGEVVELPEAEIERLTGLGFLVALDDKPHIERSRWRRPFPTILCCYRTSFQISPQSSRRRNRRTRYATGREGKGGSLSREGQAIVQSRALKTKSTPALDLIAKQKHR